MRDRAQLDHPQVTTRGHGIELHIDETDEFEHARDEQLAAQFENGERPGLGGQLIFPRLAHTMQEKLYVSFSRENAGRRKTKR